MKSRVSITFVAVMALCASAEAALEDESTLDNPVVIVGNQDANGDVVISEGDAIPLSEFARRGSADRQTALNTAAIAQNTADIDRLDDQVDDLKSKVDNVTALVAALDFERPKEGKPLRFSLGSAVYQDQSAIGVGLTAVLKDVDMAVGFSTTGDETLGKASLGISFP